VVVLDNSFVGSIARAPRLLRHVVVSLAIFLCGLMLMLARSSPALAADSHSKDDHGKQSSATAQRQDGASHHHDQEIGGSGGGDGNGDGDGKHKSGASQKAAGSAGG
jgi:hypothetical protein